MYTCNEFFRLKRVAETNQELQDRQATEKEIKEYLEYLRENFGVGLSNIAAILDMPASETRNFLKQYYTAKDVSKKFEDAGPNQEQRKKLTEWLEYSKRRKEDFCLMQRAGREGEVHYYDDIEDIIPVTWTKLKTLPSREKGFYFEFLLTHYPANFPVYEKKFEMPNAGYFKNEVGTLRAHDYISDGVKRTRKRIDPEKFLEWFGGDKPKPHEDVVKKTCEEEVKTATETKTNEDFRIDFLLPIRITLNLRDPGDRKFLDEIMSNPDIGKRIEKITY